MGRKSVSKKAVVTEVSVTTKNTPRKTVHYEYVEDEWEKTPKTGYTYAQSGSYSKSYLNQGYVSPNMSRSRLRHNLSGESAAIIHDSSMSESSVLTQSEEYESARTASRNLQSASAVSNTAAHGETSYSETIEEEEENNHNNNATHHEVEAALIEERLRQLALRRKLSKAELEELERVRNVRGVLRSGTRYGPEWRTVGGRTHRRSGRLSTSSAYDDRQSAMHTSHMHTATSTSSGEKYTQEINEANEERILHSPLYGLDNVDADFDVSDTETDINQVNTRYEETHEEFSIWRTFSSLISSILSSSAGLMIWIFSSLFSGAQSAGSFAGHYTQGLGSSLYSSVVGLVQSESWVLLKATDIQSRQNTEINSNSTSTSSSATTIAEREKRRRRGICCCLPIPCCLLFLLPLLLVGRHIISEKRENNTSILAGLPLYGYFSGRDSYIFGTPSQGNQGAFMGSGHSAGPSSGNSAGQGGMAGMYIDSKDLEERIRAIVMAIYSDKEEKSEMKKDEFHQNIVIQQQDNFNQYKVDLEKTVRDMMMNEMDSLKVQISKQDKAILAAKEEATSTAKSEALLAVAASLDKIQQQIENGDAVKVGEEERQAAFAGFASKIDGLEATLAGFKGDQESQKAGIAELNSQLLAVVAKTDAVQQELIKAKAEFATAGQDASLKADKAHLMIDQLQTQLKGLNDDLSGLKAALTELAASTKSCCKSDAELIGLIKAQVKDHVNAMFGAAGATGGSSDEGSDASRGPGFAAGGFFAGTSSDSDNTNTNSGFAAWLQTQLDTKDSAIDAKIASLAAEMGQKMAAMKDETGQTLAAALASHSEKEANCTVCNNTQTVIVQQSSSSCNDSGMGAAAFAGASFNGLDKEEVNKLIAAALAMYSADKTGKVDYAMESGGGSIVSTRCSETYHRKTAQLSLFGIPLWYVSNSPRTVIQPDVNIGQCWAFKGSMGYLVIQLSGTITPSAFTLEHISKDMSPTGKIDSAPRDLTVLGLRQENDRSPVNLGNYTYQEDGPSLQEFQVEAVNPGAFPFVELRILNNWGNFEYTCLYRFRVHGKLVSWQN